MKPFFIFCVSAFAVVYIKQSERKKERNKNERRRRSVVFGFFHSLCSFHSNAFSLFLCGHGTSSHHFISPSLAYNYLYIHTHTSNQPSNATEIVVYSVYSNIFNRWCYYLLDCFVLYLASAVRLIGLFGLSDSETHNRMSLINL